MGDPTRRAKAEQLLRLALDSGSTEACLCISQLLDEDPSLIDHLNVQFDEALHTRPDAVYRLVRARLNVGADAHWRFRLRQAALAALHVAITDGDPDTVLNWLTLIAREPLSYELGDILHHGILAAQTRASEDASLAHGLAQLALKRDPVALIALLKDGTLSALLPATWVQALRDGEGDAIGVLGSSGNEAFLIMLARAAERRAASVFTQPVIEQLWHFFVGGAGSHLPQMFQPLETLHILADTGSTWLAPAVVDCLLVLALRDKRGALFHRLAAHLGDSPDMLARIASALANSEQSPAEVDAELSGLIASGSIRHEHLPELYGLLLTSHGWGRDTQSLVDQLARFSQQNQAVAVDEPTIWSLLDFGAAHEDELAARAAVRRLCMLLESVETDEDLVTGLGRMLTASAWNEDIRGQALEWWRAFIHGQTISRLSKLEKLLDAGSRELEAARAAVHTLLGLRRVFGKRTLRQFADDIHQAFTTLQALGSAFDEDTKRSAAFDVRAARAEFAAHEGLTPQERQILSSDIKELAELIGIMGDRRTKASLIRREEDIDRQLMHGEQIPHSAVDMLKWLSGYLSGMQDNTDSDD